MISFVKWLFQKHQNLALVLAGILIVMVAGSWGLFVQARVNGLGATPAGFDGFLYYQRDRIERVLVGTILFGIAISFVGMFRMIRSDS